MPEPTVAEHARRPHAVVHQDGASGIAVGILNRYSRCPRPGRRLPV